MTIHEFQRDLNALYIMTVPKMHVCHVPWTAMDGTIIECCCHGFVREGKISKGPGHSEGPYR